MTKTEYREYIQSPTWQARRKEVLKSIPVCLKCWIPRWLAQVAYDQDLHVHHKSYAHVGNELPCELAPLCRRCHELETFGRTDLRELKSHPCDNCSNPVFDPYFDRCEVCKSIACGDWYYTEKFLNEKTPYDIVWKSIVYSVSTTVGLDAVLEMLKERQPEIDRQYEWSVEMGRAV